MTYKSDPRKSESDSELNTSDVGLNYFSRMELVLVA